MCPTITVSSVVIAPHLSPKRGGSLKRMNMHWRRRGRSVTQLFRVTLFRAAAVSLAVAATTLPSPSFAQQTSGQFRDLKVTEFLVPQDVGHISDVYPHPQQQSKPTPKIVLIQDAHVNYEAQKHIAAILDQLVHDHGLKLILVEGGEGDVSLAFMRRESPLEIRKKVAEDSLKKGLIAGHEYYELSSEVPLVICGVEDRALYEKNYQAFLTLTQVRQGAQPALQQLRTIVEALAEARLNDRLKQFRNASRAFGQESMPLAQYVDLAHDMMLEAGGSFDNFPHVDRYYQADKQSASLDLEKVAQEQRPIIVQLREKAGEAPIAELTALAREIKNGASSEPFYRRLHELCQGHGVDLSQAPALKQYLEIIDLKTQIHAKTLWNELETLRQDLQMRLAKSDEEKQITLIGDAITLYDRLLTLKWVPRDYQYYHAHEAEVKVSAWWPTLQGMAQQYGIAGMWSGDPSELDASLTNAVAFYETAEQRNEEMTRRALTKIQEEGVDIAAMVVGGFHTDELVDRLTQQGLEVVVVTPATGQEPDSAAKYEAVLKFKNEPWQPKTELERRLSRVPGRANPATQ